MPVICPTVTAQSTAEFKEQMARVQSFSSRVHLDFMDGIFTPNKSIPIASAWWQPGPVVDLHVMYKNPLSEIENIIMLQPSLVIIHAEAEKILDFLHELEGLGIKKGIALLNTTPVSAVESLLPMLDHVLIFSGELGHFGGTVDMQLLNKAALIKKLRPDIEIGWDGGINLDNAADLAMGGIDVLNVGGYIQKSSDPETAYDTLVAAIAEGR